MIVGYESIVVVVPGHRKAVVEAVDSESVVVAFLVVASGGGSAAAGLEIVAVNDEIPLSWLESGYYFDTKRALLESNPQ